MSRARLAPEHMLTDNQEGKVDPAYLDEVQSQTDRREREFRATARRLLAAEKRARVIEGRISLATGRTRRELERQRHAVIALVEERRAELGRLQLIMTSHRGASAVHRGTRSFRPVSSSPISSTEEQR